MYTGKTQTSEQALNSIIESELDGRQKIMAILQLGLEVFQQEIAIVSNIDGDKYEVLYSSPTEGGIEPGTVFDLGVTYCSLTLKFSIPLAIHNAKMSEYQTHPCREQFKLESYIGYRLVSNGKIYGTLNFSSRNPRSQYTRDDTHLIRRMAEAVESLLHNQGTMLAQE